VLIISTTVLSSEHSSPINQNSPHFKLSHVLHTNGVHAVEFNERGTSMLSAGDDGNITVYDVRTITAPKQIKVLDHSKRVFSAHWCGDTIITACCDNFICMFDSYFTCTKFEVPCAPEEYLNAMACLGDVIAVGDTEGWLYRYSVTLPSKAMSKVKAHEHDVGWLCGVGILDHDIIISSSYDYREICVWDMKSKSTEKIVYPHRVRGVHVPVRGSRVFFTCDDDHVRMYDQKFNPPRMVFKVKSIQIPNCVTSCPLPGQQGGLFVIGCFGGHCEVYRCLSLPIDNRERIMKILRANIDLPFTMNVLKIILSYL